MAETAVARERAGLYRLLAELFLEEPDEALLALAATVPELARHATVAAARRHTDVFVLNAYPFASVYLDADGAVGGARAGFTRGVLEALGLAVEESVAADHAAVLFSAAAALLEREANAPNSLDAERARHGQRTLLVEQLLPWAPHFLDTVGRLDDGLYGAVAGVARRLLTDHARALFDGRSPAPAAERGAEEREAKQHGAPPRREPANGCAGTGVETAPGPVAAPDGAPRDEPEALPGAGERAPADPSPLTLLTQPTRCGFFLARADISRMAADLALPVRFGGRRFMLENLAQVATQGGAGGQLELRIARFAAARRAVLEGWATALPGLAHVWRKALTRLDATVDSWRTDRPERSAAAATGPVGVEAPP